MLQLQARLQTRYKGKPAIIRSEYLHESPDLVRGLLLGLLSSSNHPVSKAIVLSLGCAHVSPESIENATVSAGNGVCGKWHDHTLRGGNARWLGLEDSVPVKKASTRASTVFCLMLGDALIAVVELQNEIRKEVLEVVTELKRRNIEISLLSGDNVEAVTWVARTLGIPLENVRSRATPTDKQTYICSLVAAPRSSGRSRRVLFCGDGTNDSIALAQATVGVFMSGGTDIAKGAADVVLASPHLGNLLLLIDI